MHALTTTFQEILDEASQAVEGTGVVACVEMDGARWCGTSGTLGPDHATRGFYICSLSKTYTAVAVMKLVEKGSLSLDDTLGTFLGEVDPFSEVTLRQLLNHTSRIPDYVTFDNYLEDVYKSPSNPWTREYVSARSRNAGLLNLREDGWSYSNGGDCPGYSIWAGYLALPDGKGISSCILCNASDGVSPGEIWMKLIHCIEANKRFEEKK